ncbi:hypothetical protein BP00DRAFT_44051 [Aspergillus indologenus CBS 114.80]|uniref:Uncharacterized protein n=1 Tax=Aspergillus indologenus CBS 114.80 TaxID=1450541 RepID=A0A2V5ISH7_9EURO|nr:hypothetical protein BP00DRAFT_44051 [Aspergillus indologenus CBS 114.80]
MLPASDQPGIMKTTVGVRYVGRIFLLFFFSFFPSLFCCCFLPFFFFQSLFSFFFFFFSFSNFLFSALRKHNHNNNNNAGCYYYFPSPRLPDPTKLNTELALETQASAVLVLDFFRIHTVIPSSSRQAAICIQRSFPLVCLWSILSFFPSSPSLPFPPSPPLLLICFLHDQSYWCNIHLTLPTFTLLYSLCLINLYSSSPVSITVPFFPPQFKFLTFHAFFPSKKFFPFNSHICASSCLFASRILLLLKFNRTLQDRHNLTISHVSAGSRSTPGFLRSTNPRSQFATNLEYLPALRALTACHLYSSPWRQGRGRSVMEIIP